MGQSSGSRWAASPHPLSRQRHLTQEPSESSPQADMSLPNPSDTLSRGSTQNTQAASQANIEHVGSTPLESRVRLLSLAADPVPPVRPPPMEYLAPQILEGGNTAGGVCIISGASMTGGGDNPVVRQRNFTSLPPYGVGYMSSYDLGGGLLHHSAVTKPGFSDETLLSNSWTDIAQEMEWEDSSYPMPGHPVPSGTGAGYRSIDQPYLYPAVDRIGPSLSQACNVPQSHHTYAIDPVGIGGSRMLNIFPPPAIDPRATYSSYPPLPLPPREQTDRPWTMDISEDGTPFISLRDCELNLPSQRGEYRVNSGTSTVFEEGCLNTISGHVLEMGESEPETSIG